MIRKCAIDDVRAIIEIINDAAKAYRGVIPEDRWQEPYMSEPVSYTHLTLPTKA